MNNLKDETIKKLKELRKNISTMVYEDIYCDLCNIAIDYDNEAQDKLYLYDTIRESVEFVDDEDSEYLIQQNSTSIARLIYFINDITEANIYKLNVYGNLENVNDDDFRYCIDELLDKLEESDEVENYE